MGLIGLCTNSPLQVVVGGGGGRGAGQRAQMLTVMDPPRSKPMPRAGWTTYVWEDGLRRRRIMGVGPPRMCETPHSGRVTRDATRCSPAGRPAGGCDDAATGRILFPQSGLSPSSRTAPAVLGARARHPPRLTVNDSHETLLIGRLQPVS